MNSITKKINVLIIDDSAIVRKILSEELAKDRDINVVGTAPDPLIAKDKIRKLKPDVLLLDIDMPRMDGLTFLRQMMKEEPLPVIIISSLTKQGSSKTMEALQLGAVDVMGKPGGPFSVVEMKVQLIEKIKAAAKARIKKVERKKIEFKNTHPVLKETRKKIILIGSSTGGTEALREILLRLPKNIPGIVVVQHMPPYFTQLYAQRLNGDCILNVKEASDYDQVLEGSVLIAPGGHHLILKKNEKGYYVRIKDGPLVNYQRPAADVLFGSAVKVASRDIVGIILTGMGRDGAAGMLEMKNVGAYNIAQDEHTCVVFGMPKEAIKNGSVDIVLPIQDIADGIIKYLNKG